MKNLESIVCCVALSFLASCSQDVQVTFHEDVAPIIYTNCTPCHRPNGGAPFSFHDYSSVRRKAKMIAEVTTSRYMPPWPADASYSHFLGEMVLTEDEINTLVKWVDQGGVEGNPKHKIQPPTYQEGSLLGEPDLILEMPKPIPLPGNNQDQFLAVKLPFELPQDTFIQAIEFVPGNRELVHHMNGHLIAFDEGKKENVHEGRFWLDPEAIEGKSSSFVADSVNRALGLLHDDGSYPKLIPSVTNYLPGVLPTMYPPEIGGYVLPKKGAFYFRNLHYGPSPVPAEDQSKLHVFYRKDPPKRRILETQLGTLGVSEIEPEFIIQPEEVKTFSSKLYCRIPISILTVNPHMHLLGTSFWAYAIDPKGDTIPLIRIKEWDFRWQYFYTFPTMKVIPAGSTIYCFGTFDNTSANPNNPFDPPRTVVPPVSTTNMKTTDEMFQFIITYLPYQTGDESYSLNPDDYSGE